MSTVFPGALDSFTTVQNVAGVTETGDLTTVWASAYNHLQDAIAALQTKVGVDASASATTLDYLIKAAVSPGHKHAHLYKPDGSAAAVSVASNGQVAIGSALGAGGASDVVLGAAADASYLVGQSASNYVQLQWQYNAVAGSAIASLATAGYTNPLYIDANNLFLQTRHGGVINFGAFSHPVQTLHFGTLTLFGNGMTIYNADLTASTSIVNNGSAGHSALTLGALIINELGYLGTSGLAPAYPLDVRAPGGYTGTAIANLELTYTGTGQGWASQSLARHSSSSAGASSGGASLNAYYQGNAGVVVLSGSGAVLGVAGAGAGTVQNGYGYWARGVQKLGTGVNTTFTTVHGFHAADQGAVTVVGGASGTVVLGTTVAYYAEAQTAGWGFYQAGATPSYFGGKLTVGGTDTFQPAQVAVKTAANGTIGLVVDTLGSGQSASLIELRTAGSTVFAIAPTGQLTTQGLIDASVAGLRIPVIGGTPTGGSDGEIRVSGTQIWARTGGVWKACTIS